ncbi:P-loop containing nucleoside triphosphate hydrolase protein [Auriculariales sp. MPI-PUGE-AT-0066]|nr:P-loop containing nucleoside triphosphate hydrolase protein [Auriculariales sp. MPI-PUGE-AT-0066]
MDGPRRARGRGRGGGPPRGGGQRPAQPPQHNSSGFGLETPSSSSSRGYRGGARGGRPQQGQKQRQKPAPPAIREIQELLSEQHLTTTLNPGNISILSQWTSTPKDIIKRYADESGFKMIFTNVQVIHQGTKYYRTTLQLGDASYEGDALTKKESERLAALSAVLQLALAGSLDQFLPAKTTVEPVQLSDGTVVDYDFAKQFMEYYCRRFGFDSPDIIYEVHKIRGGNPPWDAILTVNGRRIGVGTGATKKVAMQLAYIDVTQYIHSCDTELWTAFLTDRKTGKDLGLAPKVNIGMSDQLGDNVAHLNRFLNSSTLFRNRPSPTLSAPEVLAGQAQQVYQAPRPKPLQDYHDAKSQRLQASRESYRANDALAKIRAQRESLPVFTQAEELLQSIEENEVTICMAATGSGKTTQIPQIILDHWIQTSQGSRCNILCTQPRRLAAISVADRVAKERGETCGQSVGYQVRFENKLPEQHGSITFCTTGVFLRRMQTALEGQQRGPQNMDDVTHVIVDEAHERDVDTDLTLMVLKRLLDDRRARKVPLKVILMSATIDPTLFQRYFATPAGQLAPLISIPGRSFPVERHFLEDFFPDIKQQVGLTPWAFREDSVVKFLNRELGVGMWGQPPPLMRANSSVSSIKGYGSATNSPNLVAQNPEEQARRDDEMEIPYPLLALTIAHVLKKSSDGHVLVFMPGWEEIMAVQRILQDPAKPFSDINFSDSKKYQILILHSSVPVAEQQQVFEPPPEGVRRIILSTNVAETSVTIPDVVYVVDSGRVKELRYEPERHMSSLVSAWVGKSNLNQRAGRAGRHRPGSYYGILSKNRAEALHAYQTVEMLRVDLSNVVMHVKALNFPGMDVEDVLAATIEPPDPERIENAMMHLKMVGALDSNKNLTPLGRVLLQLPIEAPIGRLVLLGAFFRCFDRALLLAAILTNRDPFMAPVVQKKEAQARKDSWALPDFRSDPLTVLRAYEQWWNYQGRGEYSAANQFCFENFLSKPTLLMINKIKGHLLQSCWTAGIVDVALGRTMGHSSMQPQRGNHPMPHELNENGDSWSLLAAMITVASQPKFAVRTGERTFRTQREKSTFMHPSSVNHLNREGKDEALQSAINHDLFAFAEKRQNLTTGQDKPQMYLMSTTKLEPLVYVLFGAYEVRAMDSVLECDTWVPLSGYAPLLQEVGRLKANLESCLLRVYEGIANGRARGSNYRPPRFSSQEQEEEWEAEEDSSTKGGPLSGAELSELTMLGRELGSLLDHYSIDRTTGSNSRRNSRPATPVDRGDRDYFGGGRLDVRSPLRSGYNTPRMNSRPGTPSRLRF